jgi:hypothetical protein
MKKTISKKITGRKPLKELKRSPTKVYLNTDEIASIRRRMGARNIRLSQYTREVLLEDAKKPTHANPVEFFANISDLAREVNKLGVNINQISKYVNQLILMDRIEPHILEVFNEKLAQYALVQNRIEDRLKEVLFV